MYLYPVSEESESQETGDGTVDARGLLYPNIDTWPMSGLWTLQSSG